MNSIRIFKKAWVYIEPFKWSFFVLIILTLSQNIISYSSSYVLGKVIDAFNSSDNQKIIYFLVMYLLFNIVPIIISRVKSLYELRTSEYDLFNHVQKTTLFKSLNLSLGQLRREHSGFKQDVLKSGENAIDYMHYLFTEEILPIVASFAVAVVGLYFIGFEFFITAIVFSVLYLAYGSYVNSKIRKPLDKLIEKRVQKNKVYVDLLRSLFFIKFSNQKKNATKHLSKTQDDFRNYAIKIWTEFHRRVFWSDLLLVLYYATLCYLIYQGLILGTLTVGLAVPVFSWMVTLSNTLGRVRNVQRRTAIAVADLEKMFAMLEQKSDVYIDPEARLIKKIENKISFEEIEFSYKDGKKGALQNINFDIKKGEKVALVGRSGSGKTTIISLLLRLYDPISGSILVDGVELKSLVLEDWHNLIAYVPQDSDLLDISIKENILFGTKRRVTKAEIESVLEKAGIKEFIHNLPNGVDTFVGEKGVKLSGGQKQRVCIARALIKDAPILLLDEATSSLDSETESVVNKAIWDMLGDKTGVVIAHRLSTILDADKIIVMDHGKIVGIGTHEQLIKTTPYYKKLVDAQNINL
jgi:ABC-type multidrug transport system fused ATPase/permease subunit